ncbi:predicted protein [Plenodomus lingam JN3]|uniref:Predicted protein n=1 Tax=Leptosphaeria maculans (strain JN3 / isolate v23.1.3 / race Av1-4-5-6-7-8) TaxID=985895 RepID=E4ZHF0_LEPMJ|nr:predicted protein [Plenodomus lingam JN3]CBX90720.1 predicted protein [Plenodomus lingam JN3]
MQRHHGIVGNIQNSTRHFLSHHLLSEQITATNYIFHSPLTLWPHSCLVLNADQVHIWGAGPVRTCHTLSASVIVDGDRIVTSAAPVAVGFYMRKS